MEICSLNQPQGGGRGKLATRAHCSTSILSSEKQYLIPIHFGSEGSSDKNYGAEMMGRAEKWAFERREKGQVSGKEMEKVSMGVGG